MKNNRDTGGGAYKPMQRTCSIPCAIRTKDMTGTVQGTRTPHTEYQSTGRTAHSSTTQDRHGTRRAGTVHAKKYKRVHKSTFNCAKMIAWSTGDGSDRSSQHAPLAPLLIGI